MLKTTGFFIAHGFPTLPYFYIMFIQHPRSHSSPAQRIISLVPSITEVLYNLGLEQETVGITKFCVHPEHWFRSKPRIGGTKQVHINRITDLQPDLVIANKEENVQEQVEEIARNFPVLLTEIQNLDDALNMLLDIGMLTGTSEKAIGLSQQIHAGFKALPKPTNLKNAAYLIWKKPYMAAGGGTFIDSMLAYAGFSNAFQDKTRYPVVTEDDLRQSQCQEILLSSEPYPFKDSDIKELQDILPNARVRLVDGELFSWYGSRLLHSPGYFAQLMY